MFCRGCTHSLGSSGGDEAGRLMFAGASAGGAHILHFFTHLPCAQRIQVAELLNLKRYLLMLMPLVCVMS